MADHVLVVDDDSNITAAVRESLELEGYRVVTARNGVEALAQVADDVPTLILLDMRMPVMNGWEFAAQMREAGHTIPVVVMTAAASAQAWASEIDAHDVLPKPFTLDQLYAAITRWRVAPD